MSAVPFASFFQDPNFIDVCYIVAFSLFIYGLMGLTGPRTAVRGNAIAAVGMAIAVAATLLTEGMGNWGLIILGVVIGTAVGIPAARNVKMTAMPQMVALFNGVGGGAVALIAWVEFRETGGFEGEALYIVVASLFAAIVGSVSFWGSNIAFGKLQEILPGRPITLGPLQQVVRLSRVEIQGPQLSASRGRDGHLNLVPPAPPAAANAPEKIAGQQAPAGAAAQKASKTASPKAPRKTTAASGKQPSAQLAAVIGSEPVARPEAVKKLWDYIKANNLQNPADKRVIVADDKLRAIFGKDSAGMFELTGLLGPHLG